MSYWIEVTSGLRWDRLLKEKNIRLDAPNTTRYQGFFKKVKAGDLVFHYLTSSLTRPKEKRSKVVAVSTVASNPAVVGKRIVANCVGTVMFPKTISCSELSKINPKSKNLRKLLKVNMQRYLTPITQLDFDSILGLYPENKKKFFRLRASLLKPVNNG
ncbi:hypothetical protein ES703_30149 [subsurface metagenome]